MSSRHKVPVTFTFHRKGVHPPLFVAGSFTNPPWEPQEMTASIDQHGDYIYTKEVMVDECSEIQYKFRHASGDWWALDPDADTATDEQGNINSLLYSPNIRAAQEITRLQETHIPKPESTAADLNNTSTTEKAGVVPNTQDTETDITDLNSLNEDLNKDQLLHLSSTPINEVTHTTPEVADSGSQLDEDEEMASTAAEVADSASHLDEGEEISSTVAETSDSISQLVQDKAVASIAAEVADSASQLDEGETETDSDDTYPMFSHECFASQPSQGEPQSEPQLQCDAMEFTPQSIDDLDMDFDDPRLEHFPSDRESIMATMRRVSATVDSDPTVVDKVTLSPVITRKSSVASSSSPMRDSFGTDDDVDTADEQTEAITPPFVGNASRHSLQSIAEGEEVPFEIESRDESTPVQYIGPIEKSMPPLLSLDSDEGVVMNTAASRNPNSETNDAITTDDKARLEPSPTIIDEVIAESATPTEDISSSSVSSRSKSSEQINQPDLKDPTNDERPYSPSSAHSIHDKGSDSWIHTLFRTVFVDWIRNLFCWLCSRNHNQV
ncbi:hypothetical protein F5B22DRAFT_640784 [Xylaria bambusicola]|uniref:uncharacterized protein n=1 Tax=Xylaria bambusicola TaxID=326684 RepID=UPI002008C68B|nr:uncharacterized protein F5B22DRAFT_640784 [Xylaria bambusicola]KAI0527805.1 hypothetical protein F5B22DRAFT_640784 [Xylaria bambusicola]